MADAVALDFDPADPSRYYVALANYQIRQYGPNLPAIDSGPATSTIPDRRTNALENYLIGFEVTTWANTLAGVKGYYASSFGWVYSFNGTTGTGQSAAPFTANEAKDFAVNPAANGQAVVLSRRGAVRGLGGLANFVAPAIFDADYARKLWVDPTSWGGTLKGYILDLFGGIHPFGGLTTPGHLGYYEPTSGDRARAIDVDPVNKDRGYVMIATGHLKRFGPNPTTLPPEIVQRATWPSDEARAFRVITPGPWTTTVKAYQLDRLGGVHTPRSGTAPVAGPAIKPTASQVITDTNYPELQIPYEDVDGDPLAHLKVWVYTAATAPGNAESVGRTSTGEEATDVPSDVLWYSGDITDPDVRSVFMGYPVDGATDGTGNVPLQNGSYKAFWRATDRFDQPSLTYSVTFSLNVVPPSAPFLEVDPRPDKGAVWVGARSSLNRLTAQQSSFEADAAVEWQAGVGAPSLARVTTVPGAHGAAELAVTSTQAGDMSIRTIIDPTVLPGAVASFLFSARKAAAATGRQVQPIMRWRDGSGAVIATATGPLLDENDTDVPIPSPVAAFQLNRTEASAGDLVQLNGADSLTSSPGQTLTFRWAISPPVATLRDNPVFPGIVQEFTVPELSERTAVSVSLVVTNEYGESDSLEREGILSITGTDAPGPEPRPVVVGRITPSSTPDPNTEITLNMGDSFPWSEGIGATIDHFVYTQTAGPTLTLTPDETFGTIVMRATVGAAGTRYSWAVKSVSETGFESLPVNFEVEVRTPTAPGVLLPGSEKSVRASVGFSVNTDDTIRWDIIGHVPRVYFFYPAQRTWDDLIADLPRVAGRAGPGAKRVCTFGLALPAKGSNAMLGQLANGTTYDAKVTSLANGIAALPASALQNLVLNMGWEHTGHWYAWSIQYGDGTNANKVTGSAVDQRIRDFVAAYRKVRNAIVNACQNQNPPKPAPLFMTCAASGNTAQNREWILRTWPGDSYADVMGFNCYPRYELASHDTLNTYLQWWRNVLRGVQGYRMTTDGTLTSGRPKLGGNAEVSVHLLTDGMAASTSNPHPTGGEDPVWHDIFFRHIEDLVDNGPGYVGFGAFDLAKPDEPAYCSILHLTNQYTTGPAFTLDTPYAPAAPGEKRIVYGMGRKGTYSCFNGVPRAGFTPTRSATHTSAVPRTASKFVDWVGGVLVPGVDF